jgi:flagellar protein FliO/FliZ
LNESFLASSSFTLAAAAIALIAASAVVVFVLHSVVGRRLQLPRNGRTRPARLAIVDAFDLNRNRQLVIVRRDNIEHLLMIGGPNDLVIESQFIRSDSHEQRGYREAKFRDKELREKELREPPLVSTSPALARADLPVSFQHKAPSPQTATAAREALPLELLAGVERKWEPVVRPDARKNENLAQDDDGRKSHLAFAEPLRAHAPAFVSTAASPTTSSIKERRGPLEPSSGQRTKAQRESAPLTAGPPKKQESPTNPAARAPRAPVATSVLRPSLRRQAQDTGSQLAPSRAPETRPREDEAVSGMPKGPEVVTGPQNVDEAAAVQPALQASADAAASGTSGPIAATPDNDRPQRADPLELEMARLLGRESLVKA